MHSVSRPRRKGMMAQRTSRRTDAFTGSAKDRETTPKRSARRTLSLSIRELTQKEFILDDVNQIVDFSSTVAIVVEDVKTVGRLAR